MAERFEIISAMPTQELDEAQRLVDVMIATGQTKPHGITFTVSTAKTPGWKERILALAAEEAAELESLFDA